MSSRNEGAIVPGSLEYMEFVNAAKAVSMNEYMETCGLGKTAKTLSKLANDAIQDGTATDEQLLCWLESAYEKRFTPEWVLVLKTKLMSLRISVECWRS